jgi:hypothetical protein
MRPTPDLCVYEISLAVNRPFCPEELNARRSMEVPFFAMPSLRSEQWAFQNGVFPEKQWVLIASYYIHHFDNDPVRGHLLRALSKKRHLHAQFKVSFMSNSEAQRQGQMALNYLAAVQKCIISFSSRGSSHSNKEMGHVQNWNREG